MCGYTAERRRYRTEDQDVQLIQSSLFAPHTVRALSRPRMWVVRARIAFHATGRRHYDCHGGENTGPPKYVTPNPSAHRLAAAVSSLA